MRFACPHCQSGFKSHLARSVHANECPDARDYYTGNLYGKSDWARHAAASRKRSGVPDWTRGLLKPFEYAPARTPSAQLADAPFHAPDDPKRGKR